MRQFSNSFVFYWSTIESSIRKDSPKKALESSYFESNNPFGYPTKHSSYSHPISQDLLANSTHTIVFSINNIKILKYGEEQKSKGRKRVKEVDSREGGRIKKMPATFNLHTN